MQYRGLTRDPYSGSSPPVKPFLISEGFRRAYCELLEAVHGDERLAMLVGEAGIGKTTMLRYLLRGLPFDGIAVEKYAPLPAGSADNAPADREGNEARTEWRPLRDRLDLLVAEGRAVVLAIDDAQALPEDILADVFGRAGSAEHILGRLTVLLAGTHALASRVTACPAASCRNVELKPLSSPEVAAYVAQLLEPVQGQDAAPFPVAAIDALAQHSLGNLRRINRICEATLALAGEGGPAAVTAELINQAAAICDSSDAREDSDTQPLVARQAAAPGQTPRQDRAYRADGVALPDGSGAIRSTRTQLAVRPDDRWQEAAAAPRPQGMTDAGARPERINLRDLARPSRPLIGYAAGAALTVTTVAFGWQIVESRFGVDFRTHLNDLRTHITDFGAYVDNFRMQVDDLGAYVQDFGAYADDLHAYVHDFGTYVADFRAYVHALIAPAAGRGETGRPSDVAASANADAAPAEPSMPAPAVAVPAEPSAPSTPAPAPAVAAGHSGPAASASATALDPALLIARGDQMLSLSDAVSARLYYQRAASAGSPRALAAMAATYDPVVLASAGVRGVDADALRAIALYQQAAHAGDAAAETRLRSLVTELHQRGVLNGSETGAAVSWQK
jgi:type II secretory pathway predicted ATPase ExeA